MNSSNTISLKYDTTKFNIDASGNLNLVNSYALNSALSSYNPLITWSNPFLNTSNTITLKYNNPFNLDISGNLNLNMIQQILN